MAQRRVFLALAIYEIAYLIGMAVLSFAYGLSGVRIEILCVLWGVAMVAVIGIYGLNRSLRRFHISLIVMMAVLNIMWLVMILTA